MFSVVWHIDSQANITDEWFGRSIIKSCAKLSYQHAQVRLLHNITTCSTCVALEVDVLLEYVRLYWELFTLYTVLALVIYAAGIHR